MDLRSTDAVTAGVGSGPLVVRTIATSVRILGRCSTDLVLVRPKGEGVFDR